MAFNAQELESIADSALDFYFDKGNQHEQSIQNKPLMRMLESKAKKFSGGKGDISIGVKGDYGHPVNRTTGAAVVTPAASVDDVTGFTHNDQVTFYTPANNRRVAYTWKEHHLGITVTHTEMKQDGLSVSDTNGNGSPRRHSQRDLHVITNMFESKLEDLSEQYSRGMNGLYWADGTADTAALAGLQALITDDGTTGTRGGIDSDVTPWWRSRAYTSTMQSAITGTPALAPWGGDEVTVSATNGGALLTVLQHEKRQLRRYGGNPTAFLAGSDFIEGMELEMRANGNYSQTGFTKAQDGSMGQMYFDGVKVEYDPTLDDLGLEKRAYWFDPNDIFLMKMEGEWMRRHSPARPHDYFVMYRSITCTGQMVARRLNSALVIDIA